MDPGLPEGLTLDDTIDSIHSVPRTPRHWDDDEDPDATAVVEYSCTGTAIGMGVERESYSRSKADLTLKGKSLL